MKNSQMQAKPILKEKTYDYLKYFKLFDGIVGKIEFVVTPPGIAHQIAPHKSETFVRIHVQLINEIQCLNCDFSMFV